MQGRRHREHGKDAQRSHRASVGISRRTQTMQRAPGGVNVRTNYCAGRVYTSTGRVRYHPGLGRFRFRLLAVALAVAAGQGEQLREQQRL